MSIQKLAITVADGSVAVMSFVTQGRGTALPYGASWIAEGRWARAASDENIAHEIFRAFATGPQPLSWRRIEDADVPTDRTFRDALTDTGDALTHDLPKARELKLRELRHERAAKLQRLDVEWMKAFSRGDNDAAVAVEAKRQRLRDFPQTMALDLLNAATTEDLKTLALPE